MLLKTAEVNALRKPYNPEYQNMRNYIIRTAPLVVEEMSYIQHDEDIVSLRPADFTAASRTLLDSGLMLLDSYLRQYFRIGIISVGL